MKKLLIVCATIWIGVLIGTGCFVNAPKRIASSQTQSPTELNPLSSTIPPDVVGALPSHSPELPAHETTPVIVETSRIFEILPEQIIPQILGQISQEKVIAHLRRLTGEAPICIDDECHTVQSRPTGSEGLQWTKAYIQEELVNLGYSVERLDWSREGYTDQNLIVRKPGVISPETEIYFVAHMDGVDSPGADDNASGVVDLLNLANILKSYSFNRTIVLLFSTGEEHGALGVRSYIDQLSAKELNAIKYVVDIDMIGYDGDQDGTMELWPGDQPASLTFAQDINKIINASQLDLTPSIVTGCA